LPQERQILRSAKRIVLVLRRIAYAHSRPRASFCRDLSSGYLTSAAFRRDTSARGTDESQKP
jgi:hypothetical protein